MSGEIVAKLGEIEFESASKSQCRLYAFLMRVTVEHSIYAEDERKRKWVSRPISVSLFVCLFSVETPVRIVVNGSELLVRKNHSCKSSAFMTQTNLANQTWFGSIWEVFSLMDSNFARIP